MLIYILKSAFFWSSICYINERLNMLGNFSPNFLSERKFVDCLVRCRTPLESQSLLASCPNALLMPDFARISSLRFARLPSQCRTSRDFFFCEKIRQFLIDFSGILLHTSCPLRCFSKCDFFLSPDLSSVPRLSAFSLQPVASQLSPRASLHADFGGGICLESLGTIFIVYFFLFIFGSFDYKK